MPDYTKGKIYKMIVGGEIYVGSTCTTLVKRKYQHKIASKRSPNTKVYKKCIEIGWNNVDIVLIERFSCNNKDDLHKKEREWIDRIGTLNTTILIRTQKKYREVSKNNKKKECPYCKKQITNKNISRHKRICKKIDKYFLEITKEELKKKEEKIRELQKEKDLIEKEYFNFMKEMARQNTSKVEYKKKRINMYYIINNYKKAKDFNKLMAPELTEKEAEYIAERGPLLGSIELLNKRCIEDLCIEERPFHCVDESRGKYLLYKANDWSVDNKAYKIITEVIRKVGEVYETKIERTDSLEERNKKLKNIEKLMDLERRGRKRLLRELNRTTNIRNNIRLGRENLEE